MPPLEALDPRFAAVAQAACGLNTGLPDGLRIDVNVFLCTRSADSTSRHPIRLGARDAVTP